MRKRLKIHRSVEVSQNWNHISKKLWVISNNSLLWRYSGLFFLIQINAKCCKTIWMVCLAQFTISITTIGSGGGQKWDSAALNMTSVILKMLKIYIQKKSDCTALYMLFQVSHHFSLTKK